MQISEDFAGTRYQIHAVEQGAITINGRVLTQSLIIQPNRLILNWPPQCYQQLTKEHLNQLIPLAEEIVLIGTGLQSHLLDDHYLSTFYEKNMGVECMNTQAACRTYIALCAEKRHVVAALLIH